MTTAIITGASRGFGKALALSLAERGLDLVVDARDQTALEAAAADIDAAGPGSVHPLVGDVSSPDHVKHLVESAARLGQLDLVVNNASLLGPSPQPSLADYPADVLRRVFEVNVVAPVNLMSATLPLLRVASRPTIVNVTSDASVEPYEGWGGYGSSKAALDHLSRVLAVEEPQVRVYAFDPGDMNTRMHQEAFPGEDISDRPLPETRVPGLLRLLDERPDSGRYTAEQFLVGVS